jgi:polysaccharide export outer membrane protein
MLRLVALCSVLAFVSAPRALAAEPLAVDVSYELGVGDTVAVEVLGQPDMSGSFPIGPDGAIEIPYAGRVVVRNFTLADARQQVEARLRDGFVRNPQVVLRVEQITSKILKVTGGVARSGEYPMTASRMRVSDLLVRAGGLVDPSTPVAEVWRGAEGVDRVVLVVDLERVSKGDPAADIALEPGDSLVVPPAQQIFVDGNVKLAGSYPFRDGMTLSTAVAAAGGADGTALTTKVKLIRGKGQTIINLRRVLRGLDADVMLKPGDHVYVPESPF